MEKIFSKDDPISIKNCRTKDGNWIGNCEAAQGKEFQLLKKVVNSSKRVQQLKFIGFDPYWILPKWDIDLGEDIYDLKDLSNYFWLKLTEDNIPFPVNIKKIHFHFESNVPSIQKSFKRFNLLITFNQIK